MIAGANPADPYEAAYGGDTGHQVDERVGDARYARWATAQEQGQRVGNPPDSGLLDSRIAELARQYPEHSALDIEQAEIDADARRSWNSEAYPPYVGPGYTEPPVNWEGWHRPRGDHEKDRYWDGLARDWPRFPAQLTGIPERDEHIADWDMEAGQ